MKKLSLSILLITAVCRFCTAQTIIATGMIRNEQGNPIHYAFIQDQQLNDAAFTDSLGRFSLLVNPAAQISISCNGYRDTLINAAANTVLQVILKANAPLANTDTAKASGASQANTLQNAFTPQATVGPRMGLGGAPVFSNIKQTMGTRFLFNQWVHGYMVKANGEIVQKPEFFFNYDKIKGDLYLTGDLNTVLLGDKDVIKSFTLVNAHDQSFTFERMMGISTDLYSQVISSGSNYKIYKLTTTKFIPSNYVTNGISSTGNQYDEYADDNTYYVLNLKTNSFQNLALKKKAIKAVFADAGDKLNSFMTDHASDKIDEDYLISLGAALNQ